MKEIKSWQVLKKSTLTGKETHINVAKFFKIIDEGACENNKVSLRARLAAKKATRI